MADIPIVVSTACNARLDCIPREACGGNWFQLYVMERALRMFGADIACAITLLGAPRLRAVSPDHVIRRA